jgi:hypothetical protein
MLLQGYIDDFLFQAISEAECILHTHIAIIVFHCLGFEVNFAKSSLVPSQSIAHLGFEWDSVQMTVTLPAKKVTKMVDLAAGYIADGGCTATDLRSFIGTAESTRPAAEQAALHYRHLQALLPSVRCWRGGLFLPLIWIWPRMPPGCGGGAATHPGVSARGPGGAKKGTGTSTPRSWWPDRGASRR